jgi:hypothetical protein
MVSAEFVFSLLLQISMASTIAYMKPIPIYLELA